MKRLLIIGAGGFGREVLAWARACPEHEVDWEVGGFIDANPNALDGFNVSVPIVGSDIDYQPLPSDVFVCAIGNPADRRKSVERLLAKDACFVNVIHPTAVLGERVKLGIGVVVCPYCVCTSDIEIGDHTALNLHCSVGHDARIGSYCQLSSYSDVTGHVQLADEVFMGSHASILPSVSVGDRAVVGAGSVVISKVKPGTTVMGVPAKPL